MPLAHLPHPSHHRTWLEVDLDAIAANIRCFRELVGPGREIMPAVKADAYGHGAIAVARTALENGARRLGVASVLEGEELRAAGIEVPIHILGAALPEEVPVAIAQSLTPSLHEVDTAQIVSAEAVRQDKAVSVHLKIDTGMGRLGVLPEVAVEVARRIATLPRIELEGVFMHFADAGDEAYSRWQIRRFEDACKALAEAGIRVPLRHAANSAAAILYPEAHADLIRPGAGIYGFHDPGWLAANRPLRPALSWRCLIVQLKDYPPGSNLGYNRTYTTRRPTRVAVLPVGYADGYPRAFSNHAEVLIHGRRAPVVGMISMDYAMVDVTEMTQVRVGHTVTLLGAEGEERITLEELATRSGSIPYTITTGLGRRPGRCYVRGGM